MTLESPPRPRDARARLAAAATLAYNDLGTAAHRGRPAPLVADPLTPPNRADRQLRLLIDEATNHTVAAARHDPESHG
jgi:hypothetical protein